MTHTQGQHGRQRRRSRLLGSIFSQAPDSAHANTTPRSGKPAREDASCQPPKSPVKLRSWRDVTARLARETLAERICTRFFTQPAEQRAVKTDVSAEVEFVSAGQQLQSLSQDGAHVEAENQCLAAIADASADSSGRAHSAATKPVVSASLRSGVTAQAA